MTERPDQIRGQLAGMNRDYLASMQSEMYYPFMLNGQHEMIDGHSYGRSKEQSLEQAIQLDKEFILIRDYYQDEKDRFIVFLFYPQGEISEIGYLNINTKSYTKIINDESWENKLSFHCNTKIDVELKPLKQRDSCFHDIIYFSSNTWSYKLDLDAKHCDLNYEDLLLFKGGCIPEIKAYRVANSGRGHHCGIIQYYAALLDDTSNRTNFFGASEPVRIFSLHNAPNERSDDAVLIKIPGHETNYSHILIVAAITVTGTTNFYELVRLPYNGYDIEYWHYGDETLIPIDELEVTTKRSGFFRNKGLYAKDNRLILYEILPDFNPEWQDIVSNTEVLWTQAEISAEYAGDIPTLPRGELLSLGAVINYADGTTSSVHPLLGRQASKYDREKIPLSDPRNCTECELQRWQVENTAYITREYCKSQKPINITIPSGSRLDQQFQDLGIQPITTNPPSGTGTGGGDILVKPILDDSEGINDSDIIDNTGSSENSGSSSAAGDKVYVLKPEYSRWVKFDDSHEGCMPKDIPNAQDVLDKVISWLEQCDVCIPNITIPGSPCEGCSGTCSSCGGACSGGNCTGGCGGGSCGGGSCSGNVGNDNKDNASTDTQPTGDGQACTIVVNYYKSATCGYCNTFEGYGTFQDLQNILGPDFNVTTFTTSNQTPCTYYPCIQVSCGGTLHTTKRNDWETADQVRDMIYGLCNCNGHTGSGGNGNTSGGCGGGSGSSSTCGGGGTGCQGKGQQCGSCGAKNCVPVVGGVGCNECALKTKYRGEIVTGKYVCKDCGQDSETDTCACGGDAEFCFTCGGQQYRLQLYAEEMVEVDAGEVEGIKAAASFATSDCPVNNPIYDSKGCRIIGYNPVIVKEGQMGYWESTENYPIIKDCHGNYIYADDADTPIRHFLLPDEALIPNHITSQLGVPSDAQPGNYEWSKTKVYILGLKLKGLKLPKVLPKPVCAENPISIVCQPIGGRIHSKGMLTHTFLGRRGNLDFVVPKNGTNSLELFNRTIDVDRVNTITHYRGGSVHGQAVYNFHSPDTNFQHKPLQFDKAFIPWEIFGPGMRYGLFAEGDKLGSFFDAPLNHKGYRGSVNLNQYTTLKQLVDPGVCMQEIEIVVEVDMCGLQIFKGKRDNTLRFTMKVFGTTYRARRMTLNIHTNTDTYTSFVDNKLVLAATQRVPSTFPPSISITATIVLEDPSGVRCNYEYRGQAKTIFIDPLDPESAECILIWDTKKTSTDFRPPRYDDRTELRCVKDKTYIGTDKVFQKTGNFQYGIDNSFREKSVYLELEGAQLLLQNNIDKYLSDSKYNGDSSRNLNVDQTCDASLLGDIECHSCPIKFAAAHYAVMLNDNPKQYGRLENAAYHKLGIELTADELLCESVVRVGIGNRWMGMYHHRRFGYISDKVGDLNDQRKEQLKTITLIPGFITWNLAMLFCVYDCAIPPTSCTPDDDPRKKNGLREFGHRCWDGITSFIGLRNKDTYLPHTFNQINSFWVESEINLWHRQSGICEPIQRNLLTEEIKTSTAEVFYPDLQCLQLDPEYRKGSNWMQSFLTRMGFKWPRTPVIKKVIRTVIKLAFMAMVSWLLYQMLAWLNVVILATEVPAGKVLFFIAMLVFWINASINRAICSMLDKVLDVDSCLYYCYQENSDREDINCKEEDSKLLPIEENFTKYNFILSRMNKIEYLLSYGPEYDTCICDIPVNQQVYSDEQNLESPQDSWQNFRPNNYAQLDVKYGLITDLFEWGNELYAQTSTQVLRLYSYVDSLQTSNGREIILGTGNFLNRAVSVSNGIPEGWCGSVDAYASKTNKFGRIIIDRKEGAIFLFNGKPTPISNNGLREFLKEYLPFKIAEQFPDFNKIGYAANFIGYSVGYDPRLNRMLFTKVDYAAINPDIIRYEKGMFFAIEDAIKKPILLTDQNYFVNNSFTVSYNLADNTWISYHSYIPYKYLNDRSFMYSLEGRGLWRHSKARTFLNFYGRDHEWIIDLTLRSKTMMAFMFEKLTIDIESNYYIDDLPVKADLFFDYIASWNSYQSTGVTKIEIINNKLHQARKTGQFVKDKHLFYTGKLINRLDDEYKTQILVKPKNIPSVLYNLNSLILKDVASNVPDFYDKYQSFRLICEAGREPNANIVLKFVTLDATIPI